MMVNSTLYPDGTVAALEELIGNHGGVGGEQTDAFILHPGTWQVPPTQNSADVFHILNAERGAKATPKPKVEIEEGLNGWAPKAMAKGLGSVRSRSKAPATSHRRCA